MLKDECLNTRVDARYFQITYIPFYTRHADLQYCFLYLNLIFKTLENNKEKASSKLDGGRHLYVEKQTLL